MPERRRLLFWSLAILAAASLASVTLSAWHLRRAFVVSGGSAQLWAQATWHSALQAGVLIIAAGTLLLRVISPFIQRLEASEAQSRRQVLQLEQLTVRLEAQTAELTKINSELDDFSCIASHDLKEPLRGISGYCQILLEDYGPRLDDEGRGRLESVVRLCTRLGSLIDDLLTYARLGRAKPDARPIDLNAVVAEQLDMLSSTIAERHARVTVTGPLPAALGDPTLVGEVLRNLVSNGLKFNVRPEPHVEIGAESRGEAVRVWVRDDGIGIEPRHHEPIFEMFRRLHSRQRYEGTGAGLTFVRKIVEAHGGSVWLDSAPGRGSTFGFTLPRPAETTSTAQAVAPAARPAAAIA